MSTGEQKKEFLIRRATWQDMPAVCLLLFKLKTMYASCNETDIEEFRDNYEDGIRSVFASNANTIWVAEKHNEVVGFLSTTVRTVLRLGGPVGVLEEIYVLPEHRRQGIGFALWQAAMHDLRKKGARSVEIVTSLAHPGQRPFAQKIGLEWYASIHRVKL